MFLGFEPEATGMKDGRQRRMKPLIYCDWNNLFLLFSLNLETSSFCRFDRLEIWDGKFGQSDNWNLTGKFCLRSQTGTMFSSGPVMKVRFKTDGSQTRQGFVATASTGNLQKFLCRRVNAEMSFEEASVNDPKLCNLGNFVN